MAAGDGGLPRSTVLASFGAIALIGALTFLIVSWAGKRSAAAVVREEIATVETAMAEQRRLLAPEKQKLEALRRQTDLFARGKMCVSNPTSDTRATIRTLAVIYVDGEGDFVTFNSDTAGNPRWVVEPGNTQFLSHEDGEWDGSVTYYAMLYTAGGEEFPLAGVWPLDPEFCVSLPL